MFNNGNKAKFEKVILPFLCKQILEADNSIRFVGFANRFGTKIASEYRKGLVPLLTERELQLSTIESALRMNIRIGEDGSKLGRPIYSSTLYEKIKRATFLLDNEDYPTLMISLDKEAEATAGQECVALNKVLSIVREQKTMTVYV